MIMKKILAIFLFIISFSAIYTQTEQDYFERLRLERQRWKVSKIVSGDCTDYYDIYGYHIKREVYNSFNNSNNVYLITQLSNGDLSVEMDLGPEGKFTTVGTQALFYQTWFDPYDLTDIAILKIDDLNRITEESYTGTDMNGMTIKTIYFYEILKKYPNRSEFYNDNKLVSKTKYTYDGKGMLLKENTTDVSTGKTYETEYIYEYY